MNSFYNGGDTTMGGNMPGNMMTSAAGGERVRVAMRVRPMMPHE